MIIDEMMSLEYDDRIGIRQRMAIVLPQKIFNNLVVEAIVVILVSSCFVVLRIFDKLFQTKTKYAFVRTIHIVSQDKLSVIRKTQIKFLFRRVYKPRIYTLSLLAALTGCRFHALLRA